MSEQRLWAIAQQAHRGRGFSSVDHCPRDFPMRSGLQNAIPGACPQAAHILLVAVFQR